MHGYDTEDNNPTVAHIPEFVEQGAKLLDGFRPAWYKHINLDTLNLSDTRYCIVGQLADGFYSYSELVDILWANDDRYADNEEFAITHGFDFNVRTHESRWIWDYLRERWILEIHDRLGV